MAYYLGPLPQEQRVRWRIDRANPSSYRRTWFGTETQLKLIAAIEQRFAETLEFDSDPKGACTLSATYVNKTVLNGGAEVAKETQELDTEAIQQSIFLNKTFQALDAREQLLIRKVFENQETRTDALTVLRAPLVIVNGDVVGGIRPAFFAMAVRAYDLMVAGTEHFENYSFVLTRTRNVSRRYPGTLDLGNINTIWNTDQLVSYVQNPTLFEVPSLQLTPSEAAKNLSAGWRMKQCRVTDVSDGSRNMIEQWQLAKWSRDLYDLKP
jgi:hypothetical protein